MPHTMTCLSHLYNKIICCCVWETDKFNPTFRDTYFGLNLLVPTWLNVQSKWLPGHVEHLIDIELHNDAENDTSTYVHHFLSNLKKWYSDNIHYHVHWLFKLSMRRHIINTWKNIIRLTGSVHEWCWNQAFTKKVATSKFNPNWIGKKFNDIFSLETWSGLLARTQCESILRCGTVITYISYHTDGRITPCE